MLLSCFWKRKLNTLKALLLKWNPPEHLSPSVAHDFFKFVESTSNRITCHMKQHFFLNSFQLQQQVIPLPGELLFDISGLHPTRAEPWQSPAPSLQSHSRQQNSGQQHNLAARSTALVPLQRFIPSPVWYRSKYLGFRCRTRGGKVTEYGFLKCWLNYHRSAFLRL